MKPAKTENTGTARNPSTKKKGGRPRVEPSKVIPPRELRRLAAMGLVDKEIAEIIGICERTLNYWKKKDEKFLAVLNEGKEIANNRVGKSLFQRAMGYDHPEITLEKRGAKKAKVVKIVMKHYPGDVRAQLIWLCNRDEKHWKNPGNIEVVADTEHMKPVIYFMPTPIPVDEPRSKPEPKPNPSPAARS